MFSLNPVQSLFFIVAIFSIKCFYSSNTNVSKPVEYLVFHNRDILIKLSLLLESKIVDLFSFLSLLLFKVFSIFTLIFLSLFFFVFYLELKKKEIG